MSSAKQAHPKVVSQESGLLRAMHSSAEEKTLTHARDALAAERRRMPMARVEKQYAFAGTGGDVSLLDLFEGREQLLLYHFMFAPGVHGWPTAGCPGCSMFTDNIGQFTPVHLKARGVSLALVSRAPLANIEAYRKRMSWAHRWVSSEHNLFNVDFGLTTPDGEGHGLQRARARRQRRFTARTSLHSAAPKPRHLGLPRSHTLRPPGIVGRLAYRLAPDAAISVVAQA